MMDPEDPVMVPPQAEVAGTLERRSTESLSTKGPLDSRSAEGSLRTLESEGFQEGENNQEDVPRRRHNFTVLTIFVNMCVVATVVFVVMVFFTGKGKEDAPDDPVVTPLTPTPSRVPSTTEWEVRFSATFGNVDFDALRMDTVTGNTLSAALTAAIADQAGNGVTADHVKIDLSAGSMRLDVKVAPPTGLPPRTVADSLSQSATLLSALVYTVGAVDGMDAYVVGSVGVTAWTPPMIVERKPAP